MKTSEKVDMVAASLFAVHRDLELPKKDTKGQAKGNKEYRYLGLPGLIDHAKRALKDAQVFVIQDLRGGAGFVEVSTIFMHFSGQYIEVGPLFLPVQGDAQAYGSADTYARRYALAAALNLAAEEDDDGKKASSPPSEARATPSHPSQGDSAAREGAGSGGTAPAPSSSEAAAPDQGEPSSHGDDAYRGRRDDTGEGSPINVSLPIEEPDLPATTEQWERLLATCGGNKTKAVNRLNVVNKTSYTIRTAQEGATRAEVANAITGTVAA